MYIPRFLKRLAALAVASSTFAAAQGGSDLRIVDLHAFDPATQAILETLSDGATVGPVEPGRAHMGFIVETGATTPGSVRFLLDGVEFGVDDDPPFTAILAVTPAGPTLSPTPVREARIEAAVEAGTDDAEEFLQASSTDPEAYPAGYTYVTSSDLELGRDPDHAPQAVAVRFPDVALPPGATIVSARLLFVARGASGNDVSLAIRGEARPDPEGFVQDPDQQGGGGLTSRASTEASIEWHLAEEDAWTNAQTYATPDLAPIVQELVADPAWHTDATIAFRIVATSGDGYRRAHAFDGDSQRGPRLQVTYTSRSEASAFEWGSHTLVAVPHPQPGGEGEAGDARSVVLELVEAPLSRPAPDVPPSPDADAHLRDVGNAGAGPDAPNTSRARSDATPADEPAEDDAVEEPSDVKRARLAIEAVDASGVRGSALVTAYPDATVVLVVHLEIAPTEPFRLELRRGDCGDRGEPIAELAPYRSGLGSVTPLSIGWNTLRLGGLSIWVAPRARGAGAACAALDLGV